MTTTSDIPDIKSTAPADNGGCDAVSVVILSSDVRRGRLAERSVVRCLKGVDAETLVVDVSNSRDTEAATLRRVLPGLGSHRVVLMDDRMLLLNDVTVYDIGVRKARRVAVGGGRMLTDYDVRMPVLLHRDPLEAMLEYLVREFPHEGVASYYMRNTLAEVRPLLLRRWFEDGWLLPLVSDCPDMSVVRKWSERQKFMWISLKSWANPAVTAFVEQRLGFSAGGR